MSMQVPKNLKATQREILLADPNIVNLNKLGQVLTVIEDMK